MTLLQRLLIENEISVENRKAILDLAKDILAGMVQGNDFIEWAEVDENERTVQFGFTQEGLDTEDAASLDTDAQRQFHADFGLRVKTEHSELI